MKKLIKKGDLITVTFNCGKLKPLSKDEYIEFLKTEFVNNAIKEKLEDILEFAKIKDEFGFMKNSKEIKEYIEILIKELGEKKNEDECI